jgi:hypothetical protein
MTNAHSEMEQMVVYYQNLMLGAFSSSSVLSMLVGALFKKFGLFLNMTHIPPCFIFATYKQFDLRPTSCSEHVMLLSWGATKQEQSWPNFE